MTRKTNLAKNGKFMYYLTFISSLGGFLFGYDTGVVSGAILMITEDDLFKDLTTFQIELVVSITVGVAFIFALFGGWMNRTFGRRIAIIVSSFFFGLGAIMLAVAHTFIELLIGRAVLGIGLGIASMSVPIYLSECAPKKSRGAIITINNLSLTGGQFLSAFVCAILSDVTFGWRYMLGIAAIPAILQFFGFIFLLPESPRYLMEKGRHDEAREVRVFILLKIRDDENIDEEVELMQKRILQDSNEDSFALLKNPNGRHALVVGSLLQFFQQFTGINTVMYYSATIIYMSGLVTDSSQAIWFATMTASMNFVFTLVGLYTIERLGRRKLILTSIAGCTVSLLILAGGFTLNTNLEVVVSENRVDSPCNDFINQPCSRCLAHECAFCMVDGVASCDPISFNSSDYECRERSINETNFWSEDFCPKTSVSWMPVVGMMLYLATFAPGMGPVPWTVNAEIYPQSCRGMGMATSTSVNWISNYVVSLTFLSLLEALGGAGGFMFYAGFGVLGFIVIYLILPETKGIPLEKMDSLLSRGWIQTRSYDDDYILASPSK